RYRPCSAISIDEGNEEHLLDKDQEHGGDDRTIGRTAHPDGALFRPIAVETARHAYGVSVDGRFQKEYEQVDKGNFHKSLFEEGHKAGLFIAPDVDKGAQQTDKTHIHRE